MAISFGATSSTTLTATNVKSALENETFAPVSGYNNEYFASYEDASYSTVSDTKNITLASDQPHLTQETNSQYMVFVMPRYYDNIDLSAKTIEIHYVNAQKDDYYVAPVNVEVSEHYIRFGWLVDANATAIAGTLSFEIRAYGTTPAGTSYLWRTRPNTSLTVEQSLSGNGVPEPVNYEDWIANCETRLSAIVSQAETYANSAESAASSARDAAASIDSYTKAEIDTMFSDFNSLSNLGAEFENNVLTIYDSSKDTEDPEYILATVDNIDTLGNLSVHYDVDSVTKIATLSFYDGQTLLDSVDMEFIPSAVWQSDFVTSINTTTDSKIAAYNTNTVQPALTSLRNDLDTLSGSVSDLPSTLQSDYYTKTQVDDLLDNVEIDATELHSLIVNDSAITGLSNSVSTATSDIATLKQDVHNAETRIEKAETEIEKIKTASTSQNEYDITYDTTTYELKLWENADPTDPDALPKTSVIIQGGGGGGQSTASTLTITRITPDTVTAKTDAESVLIQYNFHSEMSDGDTNAITGTAVWRVGSTTVATENNLTQGDKSFNILPYLSAGTNTVTLSFTDSEGSIATRRWTVNLINFNITDSFNDTKIYDADITFRYTPNGAIEKVIHFVLDGTEIGTATTTTTARAMNYIIPKQSHGAHSLDVYMTATINGEPVTSNHIYKSIIFIDESNTMPIVSCAVSSFTAKQYDTTGISYVVYDPLSNPATVVLSVNNEAVSTVSADRTAQTWSYKTGDIGTHTLTISCTNRTGTASKSITATIEDIGIDVKPITDNLVFDFNPSGMSNSSATRLWTDGTYSMSVSDNFDWANGGYQLDSDGDTYFCVKAGTTASFNVPLFGDEAKASGKNFKFIYRTSNVRDYDAQVLRCMSNGIGLEMSAQTATLRSQQNKIELPYCEDNFMEFEFNILPSTPHREMVLWLDAIPSCVTLYETTDSFTQIPVVPITIGSNDCDVWVYRMKSYSAYLEEDEILTNFIADAKNAETMINRYKRNNILNDAAQLDPDLLAERCPNLRIIKLEAPVFTNDKNNEVEGTIVQQIYKNGRAVEDNWTATGGIHKGQGTSSNYYGESARNIDIDFSKAFNEEAGTGFRYGDGTLHAKYAMTENSVEEAYFNIKLNVASSESANNAVLADEYNTFNPYIRPARAATPIYKTENNERKLVGYRVRDTMEFHPCVVFIKESDPDVSTHREFRDTDWHFYGCGDFGNSKKNNGAMGMTDDPNEFIMEISNNINAQCRWLSDDLSTETWDGKGSFELRYIKNKKDTSMTDAAKAVWATNLTWVVNQYKNDVIGQLTTLDAAIEAATTPEDITAATVARDTYMANFKSEFEQHFQADNLCFTYLFTERHLMIDNRAKNTFWHYDPTTELISCTFDYDNDTAEGNDNEGGLTLRYGLEDTDTIGQKDVYNAADSYIWKLVKNFYRNELVSMYLDRENAGAWSANRFLNHMETYQNVKPERLWIMDMHRKYFRPYEEHGVTEATDDKPSTRKYLEMMHGSKKQQRRQFERYQEKYIASKYVGTTATSDVITIRAYTPSEWAGVEPSSQFQVTPYADMYIVVRYGSTQSSVRALRGQTYTVTALTGANLNDTETYLYAASMIQSIGDLSALYPGYTNFSSGIKLRDILVGSGAEGYSNTNFTSIDIANNPLLEKLNLQNLPRLAMSVNVESCVNMTEILADGSSITGIVFPTGGKIETAHLPGTLASITAKSLYYLDDLTIDGYDNIATLVVENSPSIDTLSLLNSCQNVTTVRFLGVDWTLTDDSVLERIYNLRGVDENHNATARAVLTGNISVDTIRERNLAKYQEAWPNLTITYSNMIRQYTVEFYNAEDALGHKDLLDLQYVDVNTLPEDPTTRATNPVTPTLDSTISTVYTYAGWDRNLTVVTGNTVYTATYTETPRTYTVTYVDRNGATLQRTTNCPYGSYVPYIGENGTYSADMEMTVTGTNYTSKAEAKQAIIPKYTAGETANAFYIFTGWDKSGYVSGYSDTEQTIIGDKVITAQYDSFNFVSSGNINSFTDNTGKYKSISELTPVEIYAMKKLADKNTIIVNNNNDNDSDDFVAIGDSLSIRLGQDIDYEDVESHIYIPFSTPMTMNGSNSRLDTATVEEHNAYSHPLYLDEDFVIAVEYFMNKDSSGTIMSCYNDFLRTGLQLTSAGVNWFGTTVGALTDGHRDIVVLRHKKGDTNLYVYSGNLNGTAVSTTTIANSTTATTVARDLVFGCAKDASGSYESYATGTIYWAKIWKADLGDAACKDIASWTHETMPFRVAKFRDYYKPDASRTLFTFMADVLLPYTKVLGNYNWPNASLNDYLQKRIFFALPIEWQSIICMSLLTSWDGYIRTTDPRGHTITTQSNTNTDSNAFIFIPCAAEVDPNMVGDSHLGAECRNGTIRYISTNSSLVGRYADGYGDSYWTRSCSNANADFIGVVAYNYESDSASMSYWVEGNNNANAVRIMFSI